MSQDQILGLILSGGCVAMGAWFAYHAIVTAFIRKEIRGTRRGEAFVIRGREAVKLGFIYAVFAAVMLFGGGGALLSTIRSLLR